MSVCAKSIHLLNLEMIVPPKFNSDFTPETWEWEWKTIDPFLLGRSIFGWICKFSGEYVKDGGVQKSISTILGRLGSEPSF